MMLLQILLLTLPLVILPGLCAKPQNLYERPVLVVDPGMHTAVSYTAAVDAAGRFLVTGSRDKTVRIWSASDGKLLRTIRMPAGPNNNGNVFAVAMSPDGSIVAAGGFIQVQTGEFGGLGIELTQAEGLIKVVTRIDDTPASRAGILSGDIVNAIDGANVQGLSLSEAIDKMRGAADTSVTLKILRGSNKDPQDIKVTRAVIPMTSYAIYLFDRNTGKMTTRIGGLPNVVNGLAFSADGRYLAAACGLRAGLRVFDRDKNWTEAFRDTSYGAQSDGAAFAADGRLATSSFDGKVRLYDSSFKLVAAQETLSGRHPALLAFSPDGNILAVGYDDKPSVDLLDGHSLARLPGPTVEGLDDGELMRVAWSADGQTLFASGYQDPTGIRPVLTWDQSGHGTRRAITAKCAEGDDTTTALVPLPASWLLVAKHNPCFTMLKPDGTVLWAHRPPGGDFRNQEKTFSVSADGTVIDFGFEPFGESPLRFDLGALKLSNNWPTDDRTRPPRQDRLKIEDWNYTDYPKLDGKPIEHDALELTRSLAIHPDAHRFVLAASWNLYAFDAEGKQLWKRPVPELRGQSTSAATAG
jgi:WD40 repeat protein